MANDYFDYRVNAMDTATAVRGGCEAAQDGRWIPFYVNGAAVVGCGGDLGLTQTELKELQVNDYGAVRMSVSDNGPHGDGFRLSFQLSGRKEEEGRLFSVDMEPVQARILIAALENGLRLREAQKDR